MGDRPLHRNFLHQSADAAFAVDQRHAAVKIRWHQACRPYIRRQLNAVRAFSVAVRQWV